MSRDLAPSIAERIAAPKAASGLTRIAVVLLVLGLGLCAAALTGEENRVRFGFGYVWGFSLLWMVVLGSLFFVGLQHLTHSIWSVVIRRIAEAFAAPMGLTVLLFLPIVLFVVWPDTFKVFPWADAEKVHGNPLLHDKAPYLNATFFVIRAAAFFLVWILFARYFVGRSLAQDRGEGGVAASVAMRKWSAPFVPIFAVTMTFAGIDWLMSLDPLWFSTLFGVYVFSGMVLAALAVTTIATVKLRESGRLGSDVVTDEHLYSLGALLFAFTCFWAYIAFSQYLLIWYANVPEETGYLFQRLNGGWLGVSVALAVARFAAPFLILLGRHAKMNPRTLVWVSGLILAGQVLDLYWLVMPELHHAAPVLGWQELGPPVLMCGAMLWSVSRFFGRHAPVAVGDPLIEESLRFHL